MTETPRQTADTLTDRRHPDGDTPTTDTLTDRDTLTDSRHPNRQQTSQQIADTLTDSSSDRSPAKGAEGPASQG